MNPSAISPSPQLDPLRHDRQHRDRHAAMRTGMCSAVAAGSQARASAGGAPEALPLTTRSNLTNFEFFSHQLRSDSAFLGRIFSFTSRCSQARTSDLWRSERGRPADRVQSKWYPSAATTRHEPSPAAPAPSGGRAGSPAGG